MRAAIARISERPSLARPSTCAAGRRKRYEAAVRQWRFEPTLLNGVPVDVMMTVTVAFRLD